MEKAKQTCLRLVIKVNVNSHAMLVACTLDIMHVMKTAFCLCGLPPHNPREPITIVSDEENIEQNPAEGFLTKHLSSTPHTVKS